METINVALLGIGTIGTGVARLLLEQGDRLREATGKNIVLTRICDKDITTDRGLVFPKGVLTNRVEDILDDPQISVVIELIGGIEPARTFVLRLLENGKSIITANKALLAGHGRELFDMARTYGRTIAFEASVCGGIPLLGSMMTSLQANRFRSIHAIANGTSNFILSRMSENGTDYNSAVKEAQEKGYAEADPAMDVDGTDAIQKLTILAQLAFGVRADWKTLPRTGIESIEPIDFQYASELGYRIKLLAVAESTVDGLELHVSPTLVRKDNPLAQAKDAFNAVRITGDSVGPVFFQGLGAGQMPTASAVVGDLIDTVCGRTSITFRIMDLWSDSRNGIPLKNHENIYGKSFLRMDVTDKPGVLHEISGIFGQHDISIASMIQHGTTGDASGKPVSLIMTTHEAREGDVLRAMETMVTLPCVRGQIVRMRVLD